MKTQYKRVEQRGKPVRGLWRRGEKFYARLSLEDDEGRKAVKWVPLEAATIAAAVEELGEKKVDRKRNKLKARPMSPKLSDFIAEYKARLKLTGKKPRSIITEKGNLKPWATLGHLRLDRLRAHHVRDVMRQAIADGRSPRTANLYVVALSNVLHEAKRDGYLAAPLATQEVEALPYQAKKRSLVSAADIDRLLCHVEASKNGEQFRDYVRFLQYTGAREKEALQTRWQDVDLANGQVTIGALGDTKNRRGRVVDTSAQLKALLEGMKARQVGVSEWIFPSPQRGEKDIPARSFRETLKLVRKAAGLPKFGFHDLRHHFISHAVMSQIDFMTIAAWVGHRDGGVLIGKVYGHLANEHRQNMAAKLNFGQPQLVKEARA